MLQQRLSKTGFNLIELSIVLAVIGLVIGGIYVAATDVQRQKRINEEIPAMVQLVQIAGPFYPAKTAPTEWTDVTADLLAAKLVPANLINSDGTGLWTAYYHPLVVEVMGGFTRISLNSDAGNRISVDECMSLVPQISAGAKFMLTQIDVIAGATTSITTFPVSPEASGCVDDVEQIQWTFRPTAN